MSYRLLLATVCTLHVACASATGLTLATEEYPPFNMTDARTGQPTGITVDKVVELMRRAGEPYSIASYPWARAYEMALRTADTCVFAASRTPERESRFAWIGPLAQNDWTIFARSSDDWKPRTLEDLRPFTIGSYLNAAPGQYLKEHGYKVDVSSSESQNPAKLLNRRIDYWATGEIAGRNMVAKAGLTAQIKPLFTFRLSELYMACNVAMAPERVARLNRVLKEMDRDGTSASIDRKYQ